MDLTADQKSKQQTFRCLRVRKRALGFHPSSKLPVKPLNDIGRAQRLPLALGKAVKGEQLLSTFLQTRSDLRGQLLPLQDKFPIGFPAFIQRVGSDNPVIVASHLFQGMPWHMALQVAKFMHRTHLHRHFGPALFYSGSKSLVPTLANPQGHQHRSREDLVGYPDPERDGIEVEHRQGKSFKRALAPGTKQRLKPSDNARDRALGERGATQQGIKSPPNTTPVGPSQITSQKGTVHRWGSAP